MQTRFSLAQLADPDIAESNKILRTCVHCGFCTATCPTYVLLGDERDSPRGRIYLIKDMLEQGRPATADVVTHIDRCLSCLSCMTTCPSGVHYMHLVDHARTHIERTYRRPLRDRLIRWLLAVVLPYPERMRAALAAVPLARPFAGLLSAIGLTPLAAMLRLAPPAGSKSSPPPDRRIHPVDGQRKGRVVLLQGCANRVLGANVNAATIRLLNRIGIEVVTPEDEVCCGALVHHMGRENEAHAQAKANIDLWTREIEGEGLDAIVINASGCGTTIKDYGFMLRSDPAYAGKAARVSALARDISEYLFTLPQAEQVQPTGLTVAYHAACSLQHGQRVIRQPKELLARFGFIVKDIPEGHLCCGSAGTYNILQSEIAQTLRDRKIANIAQLSPDVIAAGNIGCMTQIASGTAIPVVHPVELIDWATGGPKPAELSGGVQGMPVKGDLVTAAKTSAPA
ncbi:MAG: glycolate oxidase subunit GlcF [Pseudomonadota bacterium]